MNLTSTSMSNAAGLKKRGIAMPPKPVVRFEIMITLTNGVRDAEYEFSGALKIWLPHGKPPLGFPWAIAPDRTSSRNWQMLWDDLPSDSPSSNGAEAIVVVKTP